MKKVITLLLLAFATQLFAQDFKVLVFHKTNGYRHTGAINAGITMFEDLGEENGWSVDNTQDASVFTTANLAQYEVIIWANTSGGNLLNEDQQNAMKSFVQSGKGFIGIHAATDTYRGTNANSTWEWYNELVGAIVQTSPNHTSNNTSGTSNILTTHEITDHLGTTWTRPEEWYYWKENGGWVDPNNIVLLELEETGNQEYDETRPITWYKEFDGGRSFYTAMGHNGDDYTNDTEFIEMIRKAVLWTANIELIDNCPNDPEKTEPGNCGCGTPESQNCGVPYDVEGFIEAEDFSNKSDDPIVEGGGTNGNMGNIRDGSFIEYDINVQEAGTYELTISASVGNNAGGDVEFVSGETVVGNITISEITGWSNYQDFTTTLTFPTSGPQTLRLNFSCENTYTLNYDYIDFKYLLPTATSDYSYFSLDVFPNPANNEINIEKGSETVDISILNMKMQEVLSYTGSTEKLDVSTLESGIYQIRINTGDDLKTGMFVKE